MRYFLGFLIGIGIIVLIFVIVLKAFSGHKTTPTTPLVSYANTNTTMVYTIDGPINANQIHQKIRIIVGENQNEIQIISGYQNNVVTSKTYTSNETAYANFLRALQLAGYSNGDNNPSLSDDRGYCPTGSRFVYAIQNGNNTIQRYWSTSCGGQGTFKGNVSIIQTLFQNQIPDYGSLTESFNVGTSAVL